MTVPKVDSKTVEPCAEIGRLYEAGRYLGAYRTAEREGILRVPLVCSVRRGGKHA